MIDVAELAPAEPPIETESRLDNVGTLLGSTAAHTELDSASEVLDPVDFTVTKEHSFSNPHREGPDMELKVGSNERDFSNWLQQLTPYMYEQARVLWSHGNDDRISHDDLVQEAYIRLFKHYATHGDVAGSLVRSLVTGSMVDYLRVHSPVSKREVHIMKSAAQMLKDGVSVDETKKQLIDIYPSKQSNVSDVRIQVLTDVVSGVSRLSPTTTSLDRILDSGVWEPDCNYDPANSAQVVSETTVDTLTDELLLAGRALLAKHPDRRSRYMDILMRRFKSDETIKSIAESYGLPENAINKQLPTITSALRDGVANMGYEMADVLDALGLSS